MTQQQKLKIRISKFKSLSRELRKWNNNSASLACDIGATPQYMTEDECLNEIVEILIEIDSKFIVINEDETVTLSGTHQEQSNLIKDAIYQLVD